MIPKRIIIHHSLTNDGVTVSWQAIRQYHMSYHYNGKIITKDEAIELAKQNKQIESPWSDIGYHYGVELVNFKHEILVGRMMNKVGAHTTGENYDSLGICFIGNFDVIEITPEQWLLGIHLVRSLLEVFNLKSDDVYGHNQFSTKTCPGRLFDLDAFRGAL